MEKLENSTGLMSKAGVCLGVNPQWIQTVILMRQSQEAKQGEILRSWTFTPMWECRIAAPSGMRLEEPYLTEGDDRATLTS